VLRTTVILGLVFAGAVAWLLGSVAASRELAQVPRPAGPQPARFMLTGTSSCASAACHNQEVEGIKGREFGASLQDVAHRRAYGVLSNARSQQIVRNYYPELKNAPVVSPERDALCIKCHVHPAIQQASILEVDGIRRFRLEDGVSCEACHGAAGEYLGRHFRPEWKTLTPAEKADEYGMADVRSIGGRARTCVQCHVGTPDAEVNHDLIAAGHPRLAFEFTGYHSLMGKHWDEGLDRNPAMGGRVDFEKQAWLEGQLVTLDANLVLLKHRLANKRIELAEYDCYACHHDLVATGGKQDRDFSERKPGELPWNTWSTSQLKNVAQMLGTPNTTQVPALAKQMQRLGDVDPALVDGSIAEIRNWLQTAENRPGAAFSARDALKKVQPKAPFGTWDEAAQYHNVVRAFEQNRLDMLQPEIPGLRFGLVELRNSLLPGRRYRLPKVQEAVDRVKNAVE
jgi:hypothetical protein